MDYLYIQVSLDGATAETNDAIRGNWTFGQATRGMKFLVDAGFQNLSTNTVVTAVNFREIVQIYELGRTYGVRRGFPGSGRREVRNGSGMNTISTRPSFRSCRSS